ncbi:hypothetical protein [Methylovulum psychrotolerans]|uniref:Uncharacterized protein n=1 Tax=Methylovulum psychrotolerans TaxID=1704499 RepID=A0A2S5CG77_9GAMM|nr:hypothetical protein [Methylovulum psychrotolerans]POZ49811.1 hypothetical protein AADEFJLK_04426 [Methylovulum psychrotolerans]
MKSVVASVSGERPLLIKGAEADECPLREKVHYEKLPHPFPTHKNSVKAIELMHRLDCERYKADFDYETMKSMYGAEIADSVFHK